MSKSSIWCQQLFGQALCPKLNISTLNIFFSSCLFHKIYAKLLKRKFTVWLLIHQKNYKQYKHSWQIPSLSFSPSILYRILGNFIIYRSSVYLISDIFKNFHVLNSQHAYTILIQIIEVNFSEKIEY